MLPLVQSVSIAKENVRYSEILEEKRAQVLLNLQRTIFKCVPNWSVNYYTCVLLLLNEKNYFLQLYKEKTKDRHCCLKLPHRKPQETSVRVF